MYDVSQVSILCQNEMYSLHNIIAQIFILKFVVEILLFGENCDIFEKIPEFYCNISNIYLYIYEMSTRMKYKRAV